MQFDRVLYTTLIFLSLLRQAAEAYLEHSRTSTMDLVLQTAKRCQLFLQKSSIVDVRLGSKDASDQFTKRKQR